jgi:Ca2+-binding RTX toxin-like protein
MVGGQGNDSYTVDNAGDAITEQSGEGVDSVQSSITYVLSTTLEHLTLTTGNTNGTGNHLNNAINGSTGNNILTGGAGNDTLSGAKGNDQLWGGDGDDTLYGGSDEDKYYGGAGNDWIVADVGTDYFDGGDGIDTADFRYLTGVSTIDLVANPGEILLSLEDLYSGSGADTLSGSAVDNYINGGAGNDTIAGREGNDTLEGAAGNDYSTAMMETICSSGTERTR